MKKVTTPIDRIKKLSGCTRDIDLAKLLDTNQPQISRWRNKGFHESTRTVIDFLLSIISKQKRELSKIKKELNELKASRGIND